MMEYAEKGDLRQHMMCMTEHRARDIMAFPILQALVVLQKQVRGQIPLYHCLHQHRSDPVRQLMLCATSYLCSCRGSSTAI